LYPSKRVGELFGLDLKIRYSQPKVPAVEWSTSGKVDYSYDGVPQIIFVGVNSTSYARAKSFQVFGRGWWYDREIALLPPLVKIRERLPTMNELQVLPRPRWTR
jgi:hypothetical protein